MNMYNNQQMFMGGNQQMGNPEPIRKERLRVKLTREET